MQDHLCLQAGCLQWEAPELEQLRWSVTMPSTLLPGSVVHCLAPTLAKQTLRESGCMASTPVLLLCQLLVAGVTCAGSGRAGW